MPESAPTEPSRLFLTGFSGFLGEYLAAQLLDRRPDATLFALVRPSSMARTMQRLEGMAEEKRARIHLIPGDISLPGLGLPSPEPRIERITEIFHLAALYDLGCPLSLAEQVNVEGTAHILDFAANCSSLQRLHYVSTCYVAGTHVGPFAEEDLDLGQGFLNNYDRTKFAAEKRVRERMDDLPITIYRPAIIVGDSRSGRIPKFDGPYFVMNAMRRLPRYAPFFLIGSGDHPANLVPVDYVAAALAHLSGMEESLGRCYHLADPTPLTARELARSMMAHLDRHLLLLPTPLPLARLLLSPRPIQNFLGLPPYSLPYFDYRARFATTRAEADLRDSGIRCPHVLDYLPVLVDYWKQQHR